MPRAKGCRDIAEVSDKALVGFPPGPICRCDGEQMEKARQSRASAQYLVWKRICACRDKAAAFQMVTGGMPVSLNFHLRPNGRQPMMRELSGLAGPKSLQPNWEVAGPGSSMCLSRSRQPLRIGPRRHEPPPYM